VFSWDHDLTFTRHHHRNIMDRRQILRTGTLGSLGYLVAKASPTALGQTRTPGANDRIRVGIVGFSDRLRSSLLPAFFAFNKEFNCEWPD
jgi:hypothetical protein